MPWWRRTEDVLKTSSRRLQCNIFLSSKTSWKRLEDVLKTQLQDVLQTRLEGVLKTSWRCPGRRLEDILQDVLKTFYEDVLQIRLEDVLKTSWKMKSVTLKTSWRRLGKQKMFARKSVSLTEVRVCTLLRRLKLFTNQWDVAKASKVGPSYGRLSWDVVMTSWHGPRRSNWSL